MLCWKTYSKTHRINAKTLLITQEPNNGKTLIENEKPRLCNIFRTKPCNSETKPASQSSLSVTLHHECGNQSILMRPDYFIRIKCPFSVARTTRIYSECFSKRLIINLVQLSEFRGIHAEKSWVKVLHSITNIFSTIYLNVS